MRTKHFVRSLALPSATSAAALVLSAATLSAASEHTIFNPTPRDQMRDMSTDRPDTTESPMSVDAGHVQMEWEALSWSRNKDATEITTTANSAVNLKVGLTDRIDLQIVPEYWRQVRTKNRATGDTVTTSGMGDLDVRVKINLWGNDGRTPTAAALMPYVTLPTHHRDFGGDRHIAGGLIFPLGFTPYEGFDAALMLQVDLVRNASDTGWSTVVTQTATVSHDLIGDLGGFVELVNSVTSDDGSDGETLFDAGLTYAPTPDLQFDAGVNVGLSEAADDVRLFVGVSFRY